MEPFDYPDNDPGPQTLLTSLAPQQNVDRLHWLMGRFQGYVGLINMMGARFTASEQAFAPVLQEAEKRGLIFVDDGSNPRSVAGRIAGANNLPFAKADVTIDAVAYAGRNRPRARRIGDGRPPASLGRRHCVGVARIDCAHRQMGKIGREPRRAPGSDHGGGNEREAILTTDGRSTLVRL